MLKRFDVFLIIMLLPLTVLAKSGQVDFLVNGNFSSTSQTQLKVGQELLKPDAFGYVTLSLPEGDHQLKIFEKEIERSISFRVVAGERTQLIINLFEQDQQVERLEPELINKKNPLSNKEQGQVGLKLMSLKGEPVGGAQVFVRGTAISARSDRAGLVVMKLPVGEHTLSVIHKKYATQMVRNLKIKKDQKVSHKVELTPSGLVLDDFVVLAPNLKGSIQAMIEVRRKASSVADVMSAEQMSKTGDSDAAGSLRRVTGLTLKDGKYVYIRGLGERYSSTLLNGVALPSPDPARRVIPLDLFPVQFLESMLIQKSYSPDQPGEFGGGVVMLQTKTMPEEFSLKTSISQTINSNDGDLLGYEGGSSDWLGIDDGFRKPPEDILQNPQQLLTQGQYAIQEENRMTMPDFSFTVGESWKFRPLRVGYTLSGLYKDHINFREEQRFRYREADNPGDLVAEVDQLRAKTQKERTLGGIAGVYFELFKDQKVNVNFLKLRNSTDYLAQLGGVNAEGNSISENQFEWAARGLQTFMIDGENKVEPLNDLSLKWHFSESQARRDEPNRTYYRYSPDEQGLLVYNPEDNTAYERRYYDLQEKARDIGLSAKMPYPWFYGRKGEVSVGASQTRKNRVSSMRRFGLDPSGTNCDTDFSQPIGTILSQCQGSFIVTNRTRETDNYLASQKLNSYHFNSKFPLLQSVELVTGMRYERSVQRVDTTKPFSSDVISSELTTQNLLPGSSLTWKMSGKMQMRFAYSETVSRPDLRELSDTFWEDFETGFDVQGNPGLRASVIESYDARWEWYFAPKENLSFGLFTKNFTQPIEQVFTIGSDTRISYLNVDSAVLYGAEIEFNKNLGFLTSWLRRFSLGANYAQLFSNVQLGDISNSESSEVNRPLQGQSNYMMNVLLDYQHEPWQLNASLAYNVYGKRIFITGAEGLPNVWELPFHQLDFVMSQNISETVKFKMKINNILNPPQRFVQAGRTWQEWRVGQSFTLGLAMEI